jgi:sugar O-acyltransferase (sialic acid O-acetyltransferase NeuD family)
VKDIVIFGSGGYARSVAEAAARSGFWRVIAFADPEGKGGTILGCPVVSEHDVLATAQFRAGAVAIGDNWTRQQVVERIRKTRGDFEFCRIIDVHAVISPSAQIGAGSVVLAGSIVGAGACLGEHVSIYTNAVVEHDDVLADFCSLAPGAVLGGAVRMGLRSFIGLNAGIIHNIEVANDVVIGAGATVVRNCIPCSILAGSPARVVAMRRPGDPYL